MATKWQPGYVIGCQKRVEHDFDGMAKLGIHPHVADAVLNHKSGTIRCVAAVYQRYRYGDEARHALEAWDGFVAAIVKGEAPPSNVVPLVG